MYIRKSKLYHSFAGLLCLTSLSAHGQENRPNIVFIMSDDHAEQAISAYGHAISKLAPTPNIDKIAAQGAIFMNNYCCNSISGPSRAAILTGKHSHVNGYMKNDRKRFDSTQVTMPKVFRANGYQTAVIGKWHLNSLPTGFDHWEILDDQGEYNHPDFISTEGRKNHPGYVSDIITRRTFSWLDGRDKSKPFFLMMHHKAPHRNWVPAEKYYRLFEDTRFPIPSNYFDNYQGREAAQTQKMNIYVDMYEGHDLKMATGIGEDSLKYDPWPNAFIARLTPDERSRFFEAYRERNDDFFKTPRTDKEIAEWKYQRYLQDYLATVRSVDDSVGELLHYLKENGLDENTIVVYTSDQGFYLGEHGWFDKRFMYEESMGMPMVMSFPPLIKAGTKVDGLTQNIDFMPSLLDMCGIQSPIEVQGVSFKPLLTEGKTTPQWRQSLYYHYYEFPGFHSVKAHYGVKTERYKLMHFYKDNRWELFDLKQDPMEMTNLYGTFGLESVTNELKAELIRLQKQYGVPDELCR